MNLYYIEYQNGCGIKAAHSADSAKRQAIRELGTMAGKITAREADDDDIAWVKSMGGYIPKLPEYTKAG